MQGARYIRRIKDGAAPYLKPDETVDRVVAAQTLNQFVQILPMVVMVVAFAIVKIFFDVTKSYIILGLIVLFVTFLVVSNKVEYRYVIITDRTVLLFDGGYYGTNPGHRLLARLPLDAGSGVPSKKGTRFDGLGERLYVRYSLATDSAASASGT